MMRIQETTAIRHLSCFLPPLRKFSCANPISIAGKVNPDAEGMRLRADTATSRPERPPRPRPRSVWPRTARRQKNGGAGRGEYTASRDAAGEVGVEWERDKQMAELKGQGLAWQAREGGGEVSWCVAKALLEGSGSRLGV